LEIRPSHWLLYSVSAALFIV